MGKKQGKSGGLFGWIKRLGSSESVKDEAEDNVAKNTPSPQARPPQPPPRPRRASLDLLNRTGGPIVPERNKKQGPPLPDRMSITQTDVVPPSFGSESDQRLSEQKNADDDEELGSSLPSSRSSTGPFGSSAKTKGSEAHHKMPLYKSSPAERGNHGDVEESGKGGIVEEVPRAATSTKELGNDGSQNNGSSPPPTAAGGVVKRNKKKQTRRKKRDNESEPGSAIESDAASSSSDSSSGDEHSPDSSSDDSEAELHGGSGVERKVRSSPRGGDGPRLARDRIGLLPHGVRSVEEEETIFEVQRLMERRMLTRDADEAKALNEMIAEKSIRIRNTPKGLQTNLALAAFSKVDANRDGRLSRTEIELALPHLASEEVDALFQSITEGESTEISFSQFCRAFSGELHGELDSQFTDLVGEGTTANLKGRLGTLVLNHNYQVDANYEEKENEKEEEAETGADGNLDEEKEFMVSGLIGGAATPDRKYSFDDEENSSLVSNNFFLQADDEEEPGDSSQIDSAAFSSDSESDLGEAGPGMELAVPGTGGGDGSDFEPGSVLENEDDDEEVKEDEKVSLNSDFKETNPSTNSGDELESEFNAIMEQNESRKYVSGGNELGEKMRKVSTVSEAIVGGQRLKEEKARERESAELQSKVAVVKKALARGRALSRASRRKDVDAKIQSLDQSRGEAARAKEALQAQIKEMAVEQEKADEERKIALLTRAMVKGRMLRMEQEKKQEQELKKQIDAVMKARERGRSLRAEMEQKAKKEEEEKKDFEVKVRVVRNARRSAKLRQEEVELQLRVDKVKKARAAAKALKAKEDSESKQTESDQQQQPVLPLSLTPTHSAVESSERSPLPSLDPTPQRSPSSGTEGSAEESDEEEEEVEEEVTLGGKKVNFVSLGRTGSRRGLGLSRSRSAHLLKEAKEEEAREEEKRRDAPKEEKETASPSPDNHTNQTAPAAASESSGLDTDDSDEKEKGDKKVGRKEEPEAASSANRPEKLQHHHGATCNHNHDRPVIRSRILAENSKQGSAYNMLYRTDSGLSSEGDNFGDLKAELSKMWSHLINIAEEADNLTEVSNGMGRRGGIHEEEEMEAEDVTKRTMDIDTLVLVMERFGLREDKHPVVRETLYLVDKDGDGEINFPEFVDFILAAKLSNKFNVVYRAFTGQLVIPYFQDFTNRVIDMFLEAKCLTGGMNAQYIKPLQEADSEKFGVSFTTSDGQMFTYNDKDVFSLQSLVKPFLFAMAVDTFGEKEVFNYVDTKQAGELTGFDVMRHEGNYKPQNPMLNSGALAIISLLYKELDVSDRFAAISSKIAAAAGVKKLAFLQSVCLHEQRVDSRNRALAYMLRGQGVFRHDTRNPNVALDALDLYTQLCCLGVTSELVATMASTLANGGICPTNGKRIFSENAVSHTLKVMYQNGMYDFSGEWAVSVGLPAKSGTAGAIMCVVPGIMGVCAWSPRLDGNGNSVRGVEFLSHLVEMYPLAIYDRIFAEDSELFLPENVPVRLQIRRKARLVGLRSDSTYTRRSAKFTEDLHQRLATHTPIGPAAESIATLHRHSQLVEEVSQCGRCIEVRLQELKFSSLSSLQYEINQGKNNKDNNKDYDSDSSLGAFEAVLEDAINQPRSQSLTEATNNTGWVEPSAVQSLSNLKRSTSVSSLRELRIAAVHMQLKKSLSPTTSPHDRMNAAKSRSRTLEMVPQLPTLQEMVMPTGSAAKDHPEETKQQKEAFTSKVVAAVEHAVNTRSSLMFHIHPDPIDGDNMALEMQRDTSNRSASGDNGSSAAAVSASNPAAGQFAVQSGSLNQKVEAAGPGSKGGANNIFARPPVSMVEFEVRLATSVYHSLPIGYIQAPLEETLSRSRARVMDELDKVPQNFVFLRNGVSVGKRQEDFKTLSETVQTVNSGYNVIYIRAGTIRLPKANLVKPQRSLPTFAAEDSSVAPSAAPVAAAPSSFFRDLKKHINDSMESLNSVPPVSRSQSQQSLTAEDGQSSPRRPPSETGSTTSRYSKVVVPSEEASEMEAEAERTAASKKSSRKSSKRNEDGDDKKTSKKKKKEKKEKGKRSSSRRSAERFPMML